MRRLFPVCALWLAACSDDAAAPAQAAGLSDAFGRNCVRCHGPRGEGMAGYPTIPGLLDFSAFQATVRSGRGRDMPAFDEAAISDADLTSDYTWLTTKRQSP